MKTVVVAVAVLLLAAWLFGGGTRRTAPAPYPYPSQWLDGVHTELTRTLALNKIGGCGQYRYKHRPGSPSELLVQCTSDGINWTEYLALTTTQKVFGPYPPGGVPR